MPLTFLAAQYQTHDHLLSSHISCHLHNRSRVDYITLTMAPEKVVPTTRELEAFDLNDAHTIELINAAQESDVADRKLTVRQALKKYKKAVFWALFLSTSLIMEGYDLVIVRAVPLTSCKIITLTAMDKDHFFLWPNPIPGALWSI